MQIGMLQLKYRQRSRRKQYDQLVDCADMQGGGGCKEERRKEEEENGGIFGRVTWTVQLKLKNNTVVELNSLSGRPVWLYVPNTFRVFISFVPEATLCINRCTKNAQNEAILFINNIDKLKTTNMSKIGDCLSKHQYF